MPDVATEFGCPLCPPTNPGQIFASSGSLVCKINSVHRWNDIDSFKKMNPKMMFKATPQVFEAQRNQVKYSIMLPLTVQQALQTRYPGRDEQTVAGLAAMLSEGEVLVVPASDLERMRQRFNKRPESSGELFGMFFSLDMEATESKQAQEYAEKQLAAYEKNVPGMAVINLGDMLEKARQKAESSGEPLRIFLESRLKTALENDWF